MIRQILDDLLDRFLDPPLSLLVEHAAAEIHLRHQQSLKRHLVVIVDERIGLQELLGLVDDLRLVPGEHALIEVFDRRKRRCIAEHDIEKSQPLHVPPEHDKTDREGGRHHKTGSAPHPPPECRRDHDGDRRGPRIVAIEPRLDHLADDGFYEKKQGQGSERPAPARIDRRRQGHGKTSGDQRPEIGDEPQQERDGAPKDRARKADKIEANGDDDAEGSVHKGLKQKESAEPSRRVVHGEGRAVQIARSGKPDETVAQILALQKNEDDEDDDDEGRLQRRKRVSGDGLHNGERPPRRLLTLDRDRRRVFLTLGRLVLWLVRRRGHARRSRPMRINFAEMLQRGRNFSKEGVIGGGIAQLVDFGIDRRLIFRQINSQLGNLPGQNGADQKCDEQRRYDDGQDGGDSTQPPAPQQENRRRQDKTHWNRDRDGNEYFAPDIKHCHRERYDKKCGKHFERARLIVLRPGTRDRTFEKTAHDRLANGAYDEMVQTKGIVIRLQNIALG